MPGATARNVAEPAVPRPWKASMMPQTVPKRPMNGVIAPVVASQVRRLSRRVSSSEAAIWVARCTESTRGGGTATFQLFHRAFKNGDQRRGLKLLGHVGEFLQAGSLAEDADEASALHAGAPKETVLAQDDRPGEKAEGKQNEEHDLGDQAGLGDHVQYFSANRESK